MIEDLKLTVAEKIFLTDRKINGGDEARLDYLFNILNLDEQAYPLISWIKLNRAKLDWFDNIYAMAERVLDLPSYPMIPDRVKQFENEMNNLENRLTQKYNL